MDAAEIVFGMAMAAVLGLNVTLVATLLVPGVQVWPPPGLEDQYGDAYRRYKRRVPRFLSAKGFTESTGTKGRPHQAA